MIGLIFFFGKACSLAAISSIESDFRNLILRSPGSISIQSLSSGFRPSWRCASTGMVICPFDVMEIAFIQGVYYFALLFVKFLTLCDFALLYTEDMKKILFGIFAHPDDEAFGPSAYLYNEAQNGTKLHLVLLTDGEKGNNPDRLTHLDKARLREWNKSGALIGAADQYALHYPDGSLSNNLYLEIADKILTYINRVIQTSDGQLELEFITYERNGLTGHLDHIAASYITTYVYLTLRNNPAKNVALGRLKYYCLPQCVVPQTDMHWLYMESGKADAECDEIFDYADLVAKKREIMRAHHSQRDDMEAVISQQESTTNACRYKDHFCYFKEIS